MAIAKRECHLHKKSNVIKVHSNELNGMSLSHHIESESNNSLSNSGSGSVRNCHVQIEHTPNGFHGDAKKIWTSNFQGFRSTLYRVQITLEVNCPISSLYSIFMKTSNSISIFSRDWKNSFTITFQLMHLKALKETSLV